VLSNPEHPAICVAADDEIAGTRPLNFEIFAD
jgi:hypothetical protein